MTPGWTRTLICAVAVLLLVLISGCANQRRIDALAAATPDPLVRAVLTNYDRVGTPPDEARALRDALLRGLGERHNGDADLLAYLNTYCSAEPGCFSVRWAQLWTELEPDNGAAWLSLADAVSRAPNPVAVQAKLGSMPMLLAKAAASARFDLRQTSMLRRLEQALAVRHGSRLNSAIEAYGWAAAINPPAINLCLSGESVVRPSCGRLGELMATNATTVIDRSVGLALWERNTPAGGLDADTPAGQAFLMARERIEAWSWALARDLPDLPPLSPDERKRLLTWVDNVMSEGEIAAADALLYATGVSRTQAAAHYRGTVRQVVAPGPMPRLPLPDSSARPERSGQVEARPPRPKSM
ncbi:hypothetical protein IP84_16740 [beta proteobacterium AAP99]|nr:hypothetical protein IP84_16740 [beta proteobacterium AAP99]